MCSWDRNLHDAGDDESGNRSKSQCRSSTEQGLLQSTRVWWSGSQSANQWAECTTDTYQSQVNFRQSRERFAQCFSLFFRFLSVEPHLAGTQRDQVLSEFYKKFFTDAGLDRVYTVSYTVLLSSANISRPNKIYLIGESQEPVIISQHQETPIRPEEMNANVPAYNAYSPTGDILGDPVYCNYGREEDFRLLVKETNIRLEEKICIIRYGKIFRGSKVRNAARYGCSAVVLYSDPSLIAPFGTEAAKVYPHSIWMNGKTIQRGNIRVIKVSLADFSSTLSFQTTGWSANTGIRIIDW